MSPAVAQSPVSSGHVSPDQVLNKPLSGADVIECIAVKVSNTIREVLSKDGRMASHFAFPAFRFHADVVIRLQGAIHPEVDRTMTGSSGVVDDNAPALNLAVHAEQPPLPPNEARIEAGIGVPVLMRDDKGRDREVEVKVSKETLARQKSHRAQVTEAATRGQDKAR